MEFLRNLSKLLMIPPLGTLAYDLVNGWFVNANLNLRSLREWIMVVAPGHADTIKSAMMTIMPAPWPETALNAPAPVSLIVPPVVLYILYRLIFMIRGGRGAGGYTYHSRD